MKMDKFADFVWDNLEIIVKIVTKYPDICEKIGGILRKSRNFATLKKGNSKLTIKKSYQFLFCDCEATIVQLSHQSEIFSLHIHSVRDYLWCTSSFLCTNLHTEWNVGWESHPSPTPESASCPTPSPYENEICQGLQILDLSWLKIGPTHFALFTFVDISVSQSLCHRVWKWRQNPGTN